MSKSTPSTVTPEAVRRLMAEAGLTGRDLARHMGRHPNAIYAWLSGRRPVDRCAALAMAAIYHRLAPWE